MPSFVQAQLSDLPTSMWPAPTMDSVYVLYLPPGSCLVGANSAYHNKVMVGAVTVPFAVIPDGADMCTITGLSAPDGSTVVASHEIAEAALDPQLNGYHGFDADFLPWALGGYGSGFSPENADVCQVWSTPNMLGPAELPFWVARAWSNKNAKAGQDPCAPSLPYFNVVALSLQNVQITPPMASQFTTKGVKIPVGAAADVPLGFFSSGPMSEWSIAVTTGNAVTKKFVEGGITATIDTKSGRNGSKAILHVTVEQAGVALPHAHLLTITSTSGDGLLNYYPLLIQDN
jgi:hypothetical protein